MSSKKQDFAAHYALPVHPPGKRRVSRHARHEPAPPIQDQWTAGRCAGTTPMGLIKSACTNSIRRKPITLPRLKCLEQPE